MSRTERTPSRRGLLAGATAALAAGTVIATAARGAPVASPETASDDAELIRLCAEFHRLNADAAAWSPHDDEGFAAKLNELEDVGGVIASLRATTDRGRREKAAVALILLEQNCFPSGDRAFGIVAAALRDIAGRATA